MKLLNYIKDNIYYSVDDPKNIQGDLNDLDSEDKIKISNKAASDYKKAYKFTEIRGG